MRNKPYFFLLRFFVPLFLLVVATGGWMLLRQSEAAHMHAVPAALALSLATTLSRASKGQLAVNMDCTLVIPADPLSARGLATPYQLRATHPQDGPCHESNKTQAAFVQGAIIDPATGVISIYNPLVVDQGTQPAIAPQPPFGSQLPAGDVVGLWFGSNGNSLTLQDTQSSLAQGQCVNGSDGSVFGQFAYCNAPAFFQAAKVAMQAGMLIPPSLEMGKDGQVCPSTCDFAIVDQDQSDNVTTTYLVTAKGQIAQNTAANAATLGAQVQANGSDERLLTLVDAAIGCTPWMAPDLANAGHMATALPLNELQAQIWQNAPVALVPNADPMVLVDGTPDLAKLNAYRAGVDQPPSPDAQASGTHAYCQHLLHSAPGRLLADEPFTRPAPPADPVLANSLFTFLAQRFVTSYEANGLNCLKRLGQPDPVTVQTAANGVATNATIAGKTPPGATGLDCVVNGTLFPNCSGTATINGQTCSFTFDAHMRRVTISCLAGA